jgi:hypothetical protein
MMPLMIRVSGSWLPVCSSCAFPCSVFCWGGREPFAGQPFEPQSPWQYCHEFFDPKMNGKSLMSYYVGRLSCSLSVSDEGALEGGLASFCFHQLS